MRGGREGSGSAVRAEPRASRAQKQGETARSEEQRERKEGGLRCPSLVSFFALAAEGARISSDAKGATERERVAAGEGECAERERGSRLSDETKRQWADWLARKRHRRGPAQCKQVRRRQGLQTAAEATGGAFVSQHYLPDEEKREKRERQRLSHHFFASPPLPPDPSSPPPPPPPHPPSLNRRAGSRLCPGADWGLLSRCCRGSERGRKRPRYGRPRLLSQCIKRSCALSPSCRAPLRTQRRGLLLLNSTSPGALCPADAAGRLHALHHVSVLALSLSLSRPLAPPLASSRPVAAP